jgi:hypothetical protein
MNREKGQIFRETSRGERERDFGKRSADIRNVPDRGKRWENRNSDRLNTGRKK